MVSNILNKLNIAEQMELRSYISRQVEKKILQATEEMDKKAANMEEKISKITDNTWQMIDSWLHMAMRDYHISDKRIKDINVRLQELAKKYDGKLLIGEELKSGYKVMKDEDFRSIIENLIEGSCKNCNKHSKGCEVFGILKKYGIPYPTGEKKKCKYGYGK